MWSSAARDRETSTTFSSLAQAIVHLSSSKLAMMQVVITVKNTFIEIAEVKEEAGKRRSSSVPASCRYKASEATTKETNCCKAKAGYKVSGGAGPWKQKKGVHCVDEDIGAGVLRMLLTAEEFEDFIEERLKQCMQGEMDMEEQREAKTKRTRKRNVKKSHVKAKAQSANQAQEFVFL